MNKLPEEKCEKKHFRKYIAETISDLAHDDVVEIYQFVVLNADEEKINVHGNGSSINLDNMSDAVVELIYNLVWEKRNAE
jgi:hypothetical protein